ncbi:MAG TPA: hypothetical protein VFL31_06840 [Nitrospiraceae bacterium]|nr:hypothetical protein [Nitrospiraceae bacterium]
MLKQAVALLLIAGPLWGCAEKGYHDALVREALLERDAAYAKLAKSIITYCSVRSESLEARQNCIFEKRLELTRIRQSSGDGSSAQIATAQTAFGELTARSSASLVTCERTRWRTACQRISPVLAEDQGG